MKTLSCGTRASASRRKGGRSWSRGPRPGRPSRASTGYPCRADAAFRDLRAADFDGLLVPGGFAPDKIRRDANVLGLVRDIHAAGKLLAFICHAGWVLISAGILSGRARDEHGGHQRRHGERRRALGRRTARRRRQPRELADARRTCPSSRRAWSIGSTHISAGAGLKKRPVESGRFSDRELLLAECQADGTAEHVPGEKGLLRALGIDDLKLSLTRLDVRRRTQRDLQGRCSRRIPSSATR